MTASATHRGRAVSSSIRADSGATVDAEVWPEGSLEVLSQHEVDQLRNVGQGGLYRLLRRCLLAVLNSGGMTDDAREVLERYRDFDVAFEQQDRGLKLKLTGAPAHAFVDGEMIRGIREQLFAVLRDVVYTSNEIQASGRFDLKTPDNITPTAFSPAFSAAEKNRSSIRCNFSICSATSSMCAARPSTCTDSDGPPT